MSLQENHVSAPKDQFITAKDQLVICPSGLFILFYDFFKLRDSAKRLGGSRLTTKISQEHQTRIPASSSYRSVRFSKQKNEEQDLEEESKYIIN